LGHIFNRPISDDTSSGIKTEYTSRDAVPLVNMYHCLAYDWTVKD